MLFVWTEVGATFVSRSPIAPPTDAVAVPVHLAEEAGGSTGFDLVLCELQSSATPPCEDAGRMVRALIPDHLLPPRDGWVVLRPCGARLIPAAAAAVEDGGAVATGCGVPVPFPAHWRQSDLVRMVERLRGRLHTLHRRTVKAADAPSASTAAEMGWMHGVLFRLGCALLRHGDAPLARDCHHPDRPSARRPAVMPEVARRLERQRDAVCVQLARAPPPIPAGSGGAGAGYAWTPGAVAILRASTVTAKFHALAQEVLREVAALGEAAASTAGFDVLIGRVEPSSGSEPRFQRPVFPSAPIRGGCAERIDAFVRSAEHTLRRHFEAMMAVWDGANALRDFHRATAACLVQVNRHAARVLADPGALANGAVIDALRMTYQGECVAALHGVVLGLVPLLLHLDACREDERLAFRRFVSRTLLCVSHRLGLMDEQQKAR